MLSPKKNWISFQISEVGRLLSDLSTGRQQWSDAQAKYPKFETKSDE